MLEALVRREHPGDETGGTARDEELPATDAWVNVHAASPLSSVDAGHGM